MYVIHTDTTRHTGYARAARERVRAKGSVVFVVRMSSFIARLHITQAQARLTVGGGLCPMRIFERPSTTVTMPKERERKRQKHPSFTPRGNRWYNGVCYAALPAVSRLTCFFIYLYTSHLLSLESRGVPPRREVVDCAQASVDLWDIDDISGGSETCRSGWYFKWFSFF